VLRSVYLLSASGLLIVIDSNTGSIWSTLQLPNGNYAHATVAPNSNNNLIYIASPENPFVVVVNGNTSEIIATIPTPGSTGFVATNPATNLVYVSASAGADIIGGNTNTVLGSIISDDGNELRNFLPDSCNNQIIAQSGPNNLVVIDGRANQVLENASVPDGIRAMALDSGLGLLYVISANGNAVHVFDACSLEYLADLASGETTQSNFISIDVDQRNHLVYVTDANGHQTHLIDGSLNQAITIIPGTGSDFCVTLSCSSTCRFCPGGAMGSTGPPGPPGPPGSSANIPAITLGNIVIGNSNGIMDSGMPLAQIENTIAAESAARQQQINEINTRVDALGSLGLYVGAFDHFVDLPMNIASFAGSVSINDFVTVRQDETHGYASTRYVITSIDGFGNITWAYDITYSTDITGKMDLVANPTPGNFIVQDANGNSANSSLSQQQIIDFMSFMREGGDSLDVGAVVQAYWSDNVHISKSGNVWLRLNGQEINLENYPELEALNIAFESGRLTPNMTSNTAPPPFVASASSTYASGYQPFRAFDGVRGAAGNDGWASSGPLSGSVVNQWIMINLGQPITLTWYRIRSRGNQTTVTQFPTEWTLLGSDNGVTFEPIETRTFTPTGSGSYRPFDFHLSHPVSYQFYRFQISRVNGGGHVNIGEIELYGNSVRLPLVAPNAQGMHTYLKAV